MSLFRRRIMNSISISSLMPEIEIPRNIVRYIDSNNIKSLILDPTVVDNNITFERYYTDAYRYTPESVSLDKIRDLAVKALCEYANKTVSVTYKNFTNISVVSDNINVLTVEISEDGICNLTTVSTGTANITIMNGNELVGVYPVRVSDSTTNTITITPDQLTYNIYYAGPIDTSPAYWEKTPTNIYLEETSSKLTITPPPYFGNEIKLGIYYIEMGLKSGTGSCKYPRYPNLITIIDGEETGNEPDSASTATP